MRAYPISQCLNIFDAAYEDACIYICSYTSPATLALITRDRWLPSHSFDKRTGRYLLVINNLNTLPAEQQNHEYRARRSFLFRPNLERAGWNFQHPGSWCEYGRRAYMAKPIYCHLLRYKDECVAMHWPSCVCLSRCHCASLCSAISSSSHVPVHL